MYLCDQPVIRVGNRDAPGVLDEPPCLFGDQEEAGVVVAGRRYHPASQELANVPERLCQPPVQEGVRPVEGEGNAVRPRAGVVGGVDGVDNVVGARRLRLKLVRDTDGVIPKMLPYGVLAGVARLRGPDLSVVVLNYVPHLLGVVGEVVAQGPPKVCETLPCTGEPLLQGLDRVVSRLLPRDVDARKSQLPSPLQRVR